MMVQMLLLLRARPGKKPRNAIDDLPSWHSPTGAILTHHTLSVTFLLPLRIPCCPSLSCTIEGTHLSQPSSPALLCSVHAFAPGPPICGMLPGNRGGFSASLWGRRGRMPHIYDGSLLELWENVIRWFLPVQGKGTVNLLSSTTLQVPSKPMRILDISEATVIMRLSVCSNECNDARRTFP